MEVAWQADWIIASWIRWMKCGVETLRSAKTLISTWKSWNVSKQLGRSRLQSLIGHRYWNGNLLILSVRHVHKCLYTYFIFKKINHYWIKRSLWCSSAAGRENRQWSHESRWQRGCKGRRWRGLGRRVCDAWPRWRLSWGTSSQLRVHPFCKWQAWNDNFIWAFSWLYNNKIFCCFVTTLWQAVIYMAWISCVFWSCCALSKSSNFDIGIYKCVPYFLCISRYFTLLALCRAWTHWIRYWRLIMGWSW